LFEKSGLHYNSYRADKPDDGGSEEDEVTVKLTGFEFSKIGSDVKIEKSDDD